MKISFTKPHSYLLIALILCLIIASCYKNKRKLLIDDFEAMTKESRSRHYAFSTIIEPLFLNIIADKPLDSAMVYGAMERFKNKYRDQSIKILSAKAALKSGLNERIVFIDRELNGRFSPRIVYNKDRSYKSELNPFQSEYFYWDGFMIKEDSSYAVSVAEMIMIVENEDWVIVQVVFDITEDIYKNFDENSPEIQVESLYDRYKRYRSL